MADADYLVIGAGAAGMAFADALLDHSDARVTLVDRRDAVGGHQIAVVFPASGLSTLPRAS